MKTKFLVRVLNRAAHFDADIELADILRLEANAGSLFTTGGQYIFDAVDPQRHPRLAARGTTDASRGRAAAHLKTTLCSSFLKDIYEDLTMYLQELLKAAAENGLSPDRLIGEHKVSFEANDVLSAGNWDAVLGLVSKSLFRRLEGEKSTMNLLRAINNKLNLGVLPATIDAALPYLELRHLLVHSDGVADRKFCTAFPQMHAEEGHRVGLNLALIDDARAAILALMREFDQKVVSSNLVRAEHLQP